MKRISIRVLSLSWVLLFAAFQANAQKVWTLEECIEHALSHNIQVKQQQLQVATGEATLKQDKLNLLPSLNGFASHGYNWGKTIDLYTNEFATKRTQSNDFSLGSSLTLFDGFQKLNKMRQSQLDLEATHYDVDKFMDDISLSIATAYLQILFYKENLHIADNQLEATNLQVGRLTKLVKAGATAEGDLYNLKAQQAAEQTAVTDAHNNLSIAYLTLSQMLDLPSAEGFEIESPDLEMGSQTVLTANPQQVYEYALEHQPDIKSSEIKLRSAEYILKQAQGGVYPTLTLQSSIGTGYSEIASQAQHTTFTEQLGDNVNKSLSLRMTVPIFNGYATSTATAKSKINLENSRYNLETTRLNLRKTIQQAHADATAAFEKFNSSKVSVDASKESFRYAEQRFLNGMMNAVDYNNAKTTLEKSESEMLQAKYNFIFKSTVLDFFMGKPINLTRK